MLLGLLLVGGVVAVGAVNAALESHPDAKEKIESTASSMAEHGKHLSQKKRESLERAHERGQISDKRYAEKSRELDKLDDSLSGF